MYVLGIICGVPEQVIALRDSVRKKHICDEVLDVSDGRLLFKMSNQLSGEWSDVEEYIEIIETAAKKERIGDFGITVEVHFTTNKLPDGSIISEDFRVPDFILKCIGQCDLKLDMEIVIDG